MYKSLTYLWSTTYLRSNVLRDLLMARACAMDTAPSSPIPHAAANRWRSEPDRASNCNVSREGEEGTAVNYTGL